MGEGGLYNILDIFKVHTPTMSLLQREKHQEFVIVSVSQALLALSLVDEFQSGFY